MKKTQVKKKVPAGKKAPAAVKVKRPASKKEVVETRTPDPFVQFNPLKKDLVRQTIITVLWRNEELTFPGIIEALKKEIGHHFNGDIESYIKSVQGDLELRKLLEESPGKKPAHYRLAQKLEKSDDDDE